MRRVILHAHRDGWETALTNPAAVVLDYQNGMIRTGRESLTIRNKWVMKFLAFMCREDGIEHHRRAVCQAVFGDPDFHDYRLCDTMLKARPFLAFVGFTLEIQQGGGLTLHTDPRETIDCLRNYDPSKPPPSHVRRHSRGRATLPSTLVHSRRRSMRAAQEPYPRRTD